MTMQARRFSHGFSTTQTRSDAMTRRRRARRQGIAVAAFLAVLTPVLVGVDALRTSSAPSEAPIVAVTAPDPAHARAERALLSLPPDAPTYWSGAAQSRGERARPPAWALEMLADDDAYAVDPALGGAPATWSLSGVAGPDGLIDIDDPFLETGAVAAANAWQRGDLDPAVAAAISAPPAAAAAGPNDGPRRAPSPSRRPATLDVVAPALDRPVRVTIVVTAVGVNPAASRDAIEALPREIAVAVAPIAEDAEDWVAAARASGRIVLAEVPMEPESRRVRDPGPLTLRVDDGADANLARLDETLARLPGVDGVATYLGGRFTADAAALRPVLVALQERSLFIVETAPSPLSRVSEIGEELGVPTAASVVSLDMSGRARDITEGLALLEEEARRNGRAIGVAVAIPSTIDALEDWTATARARGVQLTPLQP